MSRITQEEVRNLGLTSLGAMLEYYDFVVFVFVAVALGNAMFPPESSAWLRLVQVFSIYAIGYFVRPVAGLVIAHFADRVGRKRLFILTIFLMSVPTFLMGLLPTYEQIGIGAPLLLLTLRILQGCAVGGELPSAAVFVTEHARPGRLFFASGSLHCVVHCGLLLGSGSAAAAAAIAHLYPDAPSLAWRLPFIVGGVSGLTAAYLRRQLSETPLFSQLRATRAAIRLPLGTVLRTHRRACVFGLLVFLVQSVTSSIFLQYMSTYLITQRHLASTVVFSASVVGVLGLALSMPLWGLCADRFGPARTIAGGTVAAALVAARFFVRLDAGGIEGAELSWLFLPVGIACGCVIALVPGLIASLFPTAVRQTGYAVPYSFGSAIFSGPGPLVLAWSVREFGAMAPLYFFLVACAVALCVAALVDRVPRYLGQSAGEAGPAAAEVAAAPW